MVCAEGVNSWEEFRERGRQGKLGWHSGREGRIFLLGREGRQRLNPRGREFSARSAEQEEEWESFVC